MVPAKLKDTNIQRVQMMKVSQQAAYAGSPCVHSPLAQRACCACMTGVLSHQSAAWAPDAACAG